MVIDCNLYEVVEHARHAGGYAFFRFPEEKEFFYIGQEGLPEVIPSSSQVGGKNGFIVAPFQSCPSDPIILIRPDVLTSSNVPDRFGANLDFQIEDDAALQYEYYKEGFRICKERLNEQADLRKVVYARQLNVYFTSSQKPNAIDLFFKACRQHPHSFVSLCSTPQSGTWLTASPETLVRRDMADDRLWHTMALAGTMRWQGRLPEIAEWSNKNREEHNYVTAYIHRRLKDVVENMQIKNCHSVRSASVVHLRTEIDFILRKGINLGVVVSKLHPTPAICGESLMAAQNVIRDAENMPRHYYAGYSGPINLYGYTGLFVSLRCMQLMTSRAVLYAGGGLLAASKLDEEWDETCRKLQPMLRLFRREN